MGAITVKRLAPALVGLLAIFTIFRAIPAGAQAQQSWQLCTYGQPIDEVAACDIAVTKDVSVNDGDFEAADTEDSAVVASIGDTVTWRITLSDLSAGGLYPDMDIRLEDILPAGVTYVSHVASAGTYDQTYWEIPTTETGGGEFPTYELILPVTLTIETTADELGVWENAAALTDMNCDGWCNYTDSDETNNANSAFLNVVNPEIFQTTGVLGDSTDEEPQVLAATGSEATIIAIGAGVALIIATLAIRRLAAVRIKK